jgi:mersacidin/lichenicidin family type 2 lantibiotic
MSNIDVIRAWKDEEYRLGLSETERKLIPAHPAGAAEISDDDLQAVIVAFPSILVCTEPLMC